MVILEFDSEGLRWYYLSLIMGSEMVLLEFDSEGLIWFYLSLIVRV